MEKDDAFVDAWRAKRKELKDLEQAGAGLERSRYVPFHQIFQMIFSVVFSRETPFISDAATSR